MTRSDLDLSESSQDIGRSHSDLTELNLNISTFSQSLSDSSPGFSRSGLHLSELDFGINDFNQNADNSSNGFSTRSLGMTLAVAFKR